MWKAEQETRKRVDGTFKKLPSSGPPRFDDALSTLTDASANLDREFAGLEYYLKHKKTLTGETASKACAVTLQNNGAKCVDACLSAIAVAKSLSPKAAAESSKKDKKHKLGK